MYTNLKRVVLLLALIWNCAGCTSLLNKRTQTIKIMTPDNSGHITIADSTYTSPAFVIVPRSKKPVDILIEQDSTDKTVRLHPAIERKFLFTNLAWNFLMPVAYLVDLTNPKRFHYGYAHRIDPRDSTNDVYTRPAINAKPFFDTKLTNEKGKWGPVFSLPYANWFYFRPDDQWQGRSSGFFGISVGLEYNDRDNRSWRLMATHMTNSPAFLPVPVIYESDHQSYEASYFSLTRQVYLNRFVLGYGLTYGSHTYTYHYEWDFREDLSISNRMAGLDLFGGIRVAQFTTIGGRYRPAFYKFGDERFQYESTFSIELIYTSF